ncbi:MAG: oxygen-dependent coproporphyrinogen oxidase [Thermoflavifilum sp.]|nr:oxygen-dependent coproporphyrinogen oxidase [Thermoflavifilum sp.]
MDSLSISEAAHTWSQTILQWQEEICHALEQEDGTGKFQYDSWERAAGGRGITRIIEGGKVFEKGGVNTSSVYGELPEHMRQLLQTEHRFFFAAGLSLVIHPLNPYVPTVHANWRYFELYDNAGRVADRWIGGGTDLTPYYLFEEDAQYFHQCLKQAMEAFGEDLYPRFKHECDVYFRNTHRNGEARGIGGVFYDYLRPGYAGLELQQMFAFQQANKQAFLQAYLPIVQRRKNLSYGEREIFWQEIRRGRYVEFNLIHDRGTLFGLKTGGRTESILMSLPPRARWVYQFNPEPGSPEAALLEVCLTPRTWA